MTYNPNLSKKLDSSYYSRSRTWPSKFTITNNSNILDIGCANGDLGHFLKSKYNCTVTGIDIVEENVKRAREILDSCHHLDIENCRLDLLNGPFDYIIFSDSIEHLLNPDVVLHKIKALMTPSSKVLFSIPNIRNYRVILPLILLDSFDYQEEGLLDRTHLRFFTISSFHSLLASCGYCIEQSYVDLPLNSKAGLLNIASFGIFKRILTSHYFIQSCLVHS